VAGDQRINCELALEVGHELVRKMAGKTFGEVTLKRNDRVLPLAVMNSSINIGSSVEPINESQLFHRMLVLNLSDDELALFFNYELAPRPTSLFDEICFRKSNKAALIKVLDQLAAPHNTMPNLPTFVFDGGHLLHHVVWPRPATFAEIANAYVSFVSNFSKRHNGTACVVFDGYVSGPSTKDPEHVRRALRTSADYVFEETTVTSTSQALFLSNSANKQRLISLLVTRLSAAGIHAFQAEGDADRPVVVKAISLAEQGHNAVIVGEDTDLIALMTALTPRDLSVSILSSSGGSEVIRGSRDLQVALGPSAELLLFLHAMKGCDTTSAPYKRSVKNGLTKLINSAALREIVQVFNSPNATQDAIAAAGEKFFLQLYGLPDAGTLNKARYVMYKRIISRQPFYSKFDLASLPPTTDAARLHSFRVYHQVQAWRGVDLTPMEWGWKLVADKLQPIQTTEPPAPTRLLKLILCNCKGDCSTNNCECRRSGLKCSSLCGHCLGTSCKNAAAPTDGEVDAEEAVDDPEQILSECALAF